MGECLCKHGSPRGVFVHSEWMLYWWSLSPQWPSTSSCNTSRTYWTEKSANGSEAPSTGDLWRGPSPSRATCTTGRATRRESGSWWSRAVGLTEAANARLFFRRHFRLEVVTTEERWACQSDSRHLRLKPVLSAVAAAAEPSVTIFLVWNTYSCYNIASVTNGNQWLCIYNLLPIWNFRYIKLDLMSLFSLYVLTYSYLWPGSRWSRCFRLN